MIKVLHIEISKEIGGIETFLMNLLNNIDRSEFSFDCKRTIASTP